jgi:hypothetical protein
MRSLICEDRTLAIYFRATGKNWQLLGMVGAADGSGSKPPTNLLISSPVSLISPHRKEKVRLIHSSLTALPIRLAQCPFQKQGLADTGTAAFERS